MVVRWQRRQQQCTQRHEPVVVQVERGVDRFEVGEAAEERPARQPVVPSERDRYSGDTDRGNNQMEPRPG